MLIFVFIFTFPSPHIIQGHSTVLHIFILPSPHIIQSNSAVLVDVVDEITGARDFGAWGIFEFLANLASSNLNE
jgi:hypothetical protein